MIRQLRTYEIFDDTRDAFHARFRDHAMRLMAPYGFRFLAGWETRSDARLEFSYILEWPDETTMREQWAAFMADEEWARIKRDTAEANGPMVGEIVDRVLTAIDYLPVPGDG